MKRQMSPPHSSFYRKIPFNSSDNSSYLPIKRYKEVSAMKRILPIIVIIGLVLTSCPSPVGGARGMGKISINVGGSTAHSVNRVLWNDLETDDFTHIITLTKGPGPDQSRTVPPGEAGVVSFTVEPGVWTIVVLAMYDGELVAVGYKTVNITAGENGAITIPMSQPEDLLEEPEEPGTGPGDPPGGGFVFDPDDYDDVYYVPSENNWATAVSTIGNSGKYAIVLDSDISITGYTAANPTFGTTSTGTSLNVTIISNGKTNFKSGA